MEVASHLREAMGQPAEFLGDEQLEDPICTRGQRCYKVAMMNGPTEMPDRDEYVWFSHLREESQGDDLTILAIRRK